VLAAAETLGRGLGPELRADGEGKAGDDLAATVTIGEAARVEGDGAAGLGDGDGEEMTGVGVGVGGGDADGLAGGDDGGGGGGAVTVNVVLPLAVTGRPSSRTWTQP
jgi:hypothetical protein